MRLYLSLLACALGAGPLWADTPALLVPELGISADARALRQGRVVTRILDATDGAEVVTIAAVRVAASAEAFSRCAQVPSCLFGHDDLRAASRIRAASADADLAALDLDAHDVQHLERCSVRHCGMRLSAAEIERFRGQVDWNAPDAGARSIALFRATLAELVRGYAASGDPALVTYDDQERSSSVAAAFAELLARPIPPLALAPELRPHLQAYPRTPLLSGEDYLCWRQERFWRQNLVTLEHVAVQRSAGGVVAAVKQLYASHYFDGAVTVFAFEPDTGGHGGLLVQMSRVRADIRPTGFSWLERMLINRLVTGRLSRHLGALRARLEGGAS